MQQTMHPIMPCHNRHHYEEVVSTSYIIAIVYNVQLG